jgi:hypothetical protein
VLETAGDATELLLDTTAEAADIGGSCGGVLPDLDCAFIDCDPGCA